MIMTPSISRVWWSKKPSRHLLEYRLAISVLLPLQKSPKTLQSIPPVFRPCLYFIKHNKLNIMIITAKYYLNGIRVMGRYLGRQLVRRTTVKKRLFGFEIHALPCVPRPLDCDRATTPNIVSFIVNWDFRIFRAWYIHRMSLDFVSEYTKQHLQEVPSPLLNGHFRTKIMALASNLCCIPSQDDEG